MSVQEYLNKEKKIHSCILKFLDDENDVEENHQNLIKLIDDLKIKEDRHDIQTILYIILNVSRHHHRTPLFFSKIERILKYLKESIEKNFSKSEIYDIFKKNKRIILFLIKEEMITVDEDIATYMKNDKYSKFYFFNEIKPFITDTELVQRLTDEMPDKYEEKRLIGENCNSVCEIIRKDSVDEFVSYVNENDLQFSCKIKPSLFETNTVLLKKEPDLIEYSAFYGSLNIIKHLHSNKIELKPALWLYAIHSGKIELIHYLAQEKVELSDKSYEVYLKEAIKCHHNDIANYFLNKYLNNQVEFDHYLSDNFNRNYVSYGFHYYNFQYLPDDINSRLAFLYSCQYDHYNLVELLLKNKNIDPNSQVILFCLINRIFI